MGPPWLCEAGGYAVGVTWNGLAFRICRSTGDLCAVAASWSAAEREVNALAAAWNMKMTAG